MKKREPEVLLDELLASQTSATPDELGLSAEEAIALGQTRLHVEGIFLVRLRSIVGETRVEEVRSDQWPARAALCRDEGFFAEETRLLRLERRQDVPFPQSLFTEPSQARDLVTRLRKASHVLERAYALRVARPRRAEQTFLSLEPLFEEISPDAAFAMWVDAADTFNAIADAIRARRCLSRVARLMRRSPVSVERVAFYLLTVRDASFIPQELVDVTAIALERARGVEACVSFQLGVLVKKLDQNELLARGTLESVLRFAAASDETEATRAQLDAALLGMLCLPGLWANEGDALALRSQLHPLLIRAKISALPLRKALSRSIRRAFEVLDDEGLSALAALLLDTGFEATDGLLFDITLQLLFRSAPGRFSRQLDLATRALFALADESPTSLFDGANALGPALAAALATPTMRAYLAALLADLDTTTEPARRHDAALSALLDHHAGGALGPPEPGDATGLYRRTDRERAFSRWLPAPLSDPLREAMLADDRGAMLATLYRTKALTFVACLRLIGLAQDERTGEPVALQALGLSEELLGSLKREADLPSTPLDEADPTLEGLCEIDLEALQDGIELSRASIGDRRSLRPLFWPTPMLDGLFLPAEARFVLLTWVLGRLDAADVGSHHLALARIAQATPLVRLAAGRLLPSAQVRCNADTSSLARLCRRSVARFSAPSGASLRDVVLLCSPRSLALAFAADFGISPRSLVETSLPDKPAATKDAAPETPLLLMPDVDPASTLRASLMTVVPLPFAVPPRDSAFPLVPVIAGHPVSTGSHGEISVYGARGQSLRRVPRVVQQDEAYRMLLRGRHGERARKRLVMTNLEARMTSATPFEPDELFFLLEDPLVASLFRHAIVAEASPNAASPGALFLLHRWDRARGLGLVPLDYDARYVPPFRLELVHPTRIEALGAWRALLEDLGFRQGLPQLFRDLRLVPDEELSATESRVLSGRAVASSAALLHALADEGFNTSRGLATRSFVHRALLSPIELWFDPGNAAWPTDVVLSGCFGFRSRSGLKLTFREVPLSIVCESRSSLERALARAATRPG